jgi:hypothetical protein
MTEWKSIIDHPLDPHNNAGWYVTMVKFGNEPQLIYYGFRNWQSPWHMPKHWKEPDYYLAVPYAPDILYPKSYCTMD